MIKERLHKEIENNVTLQLTPAADSESIDVQVLGSNPALLYPFCCVLCAVCCVLCAVLG
jgi:hypothetical protein